MANQISTVQVMASGHLYGQEWQPSHWAPLWPLVAIKVTVIHTGPGCGRIKDPNMPLAAPCLDITMAACGKQATNIRPLLNNFLSSLLPLSTAHEPFHFSVSLLSPPPGGPMDVFLLARALRATAGLWMPSPCLSRTAWGA